MPIFSLKRRYIPLIQKPNCCAAACLQAILYRNGYGLFDQEDLATVLGVKIARANAPAFRSSMRLMRRLNWDEGITTLGSVPTVNRFFREHGCALQAKAIRYSAMKSFKDLIADALENDEDVWVEYHSQEVHVENPVNIHIHDGLIESLDTSKQKIVLIDPSPRRKQRVDIPLKILGDAISKKFGRELGVVIVGKK